MVQADKQASLQADEAEVIRRVCAGHKEEFSVLVKQHQNQIFSLILRQVQNHTVAEELAQETFVKAYTALKSFKGKSSFSTWLTRIALNVTHSYFSSRRFRERRASISFDAAVHEKLLARTDGDHSPEELALIASALSDLNSKQRDAVALIFVEGKSYQEASEILAVPIGTVSSRVTKGIAQLRVNLKGGKV